jgi:hypothetical protein
MMSDGTGTPGNGKWEVNIAYKGKIRPETTMTDFPAIDVNYGLGENIQLKVESSYVFISDNQNNPNGIGNAKIGVKWRFYESTSDTLSISTYPQYSFAPNKTNANLGLADKEDAFFLPIEISKEFGNFSLTAEVGYLAIEREDDYLKSGIVFGYRPLKDLELLAEIYRSALTDGGNETVNLNAGMTYVFDDNIGALVSIGREIIRDNEPQATNFFVGLQLLF